jgi:hypothetical protein
VKGIVLDMDSSVSPTHGEQEGTAYNGHRAGSGFLNRVDKWSFCLTAARMAAEQERR